LAFIANPPRFGGVREQFQVGLLELTRRAKYSTANLLFHILLSGEGMHGLYIHQIVISLYPAAKSNDTQELQCFQDSPAAYIEAHSTGATGFERDRLR